MKKKVEEYLSDNHPDVLAAAASISKFCRDSKIRVPVALVAMHLITNQACKFVEMEKIDPESVPAHIRKQAEGGEVH